MVRVRLPAGQLTPAAARALARIAGRFGTRALHLTTRQDIQFYDVPEAALGDVIRHLAEAGLSTRFTGGRGLRTIATCAFAGVCPAERVDGADIARRLEAYWLHHPLLRQMPDALRVAVWGCACGVREARFEDVAFVAAESPARRFRAFAGGRGGHTPQPAIEVAVLDACDLGPALEAFVRLLHRYGDRAGHRTRRLSELVTRFGPERFAALFADEWDHVRRRGDSRWMPSSWREPSAPAAMGGVVRQRDGFDALELDLEGGWIGATALGDVADLADAFGLSGFRCTRRQTLVLSSVEPSETGRLIERLAALGLRPITSSHTPIVACAGRETCRHGLVDTRVLARALSIRGVPTLHVSGCGHGCARHTTAVLGLAAVALDSGVGFRVWVRSEAGPVVPERSVGEAMDRLGAMSAFSLSADAVTTALTDLAVPAAPLQPSHDPGLPSDAGDDRRLAALADDALLSLDRAVRGFDIEGAAEAGWRAVALAGSRLLDTSSASLLEAEVIFAALRRAHAADARLLVAMDVVEDAGRTLLSSRDLLAWREAVAYWLDLVMRRAAENGLGREIT
jgi:sulfite reductase (NADPH) hemoprotein beta-component